MTIEYGPGSISEINMLPLAEKEAIYRTLLPGWLFTDYGLDRAALTVDGQRVVQFRCPAGSRAVEIAVKRRAEDVDPMLFAHLADTFNFQVMVLLVIINDPDAPRFDIDIDQHGNTTQMGTLGRNLAAEKAALAAGLAPGQIRAGLRVFRQFVPIFEDFIRQIDHEMVLIEPLAYHNAIIFERYGFGYVQGLQKMKRIHADFQPGGTLHRQLSSDNPFQQPEAWRTIRGRSWAIHDGILGHAFTGFQMYKLIDKSLSVNTFPDARW